MFAFSSIPFAKLPESISSGAAEAFPGLGNGSGALSTQDALNFFLLLGQTLETLQPPQQSQPGAAGPQFAGLPIAGELPVDLDGASLRLEQLSGLLERLTRQIEQVPDREGLEELANTLAAENPEGAALLVQALQTLQSPLKGEGGAEVQAVSLEQSPALNRLIQRLQNFSRKISNVPSSAPAASESASKAAAQGVAQAPQPAAGKAPVARGVAQAPQPAAGEAPAAQAQPQSALEQALFRQLTRLVETGDANAAELKNAFQVAANASGAAKGTQPTQDLIARLVQLKHAVAGATPEARPVPTMTAQAVSAAGEGGAARTGADASTAALFNNATTTEGAKNGEANFSALQSEALRSLAGERPGSNAPGLKSAVQAANPASPGEANFQAAQVQPAEPLIFNARTAAAGEGGAAHSASLVQQVRDAADFLAQRIDGSVRVNPNSIEAELRLNPPDLGRVRVEMNMGADRTLQVRFVVERAETGQALNRNLMQFTEALGRHGLQVDRAQIVAEPRSTTAADSRHDAAHQRSGDGGAGAERQHSREKHGSGEAYRDARDAWEALLS